ncbi:Cof-type HAD-IIB family hydrolase [Paenibacillus validus]|uniref:Cof-type HAD-IIB family hydrolase n=1 Tax=Paenibacillus validus TaxID=44253 RepID=A0A7X2ZFP0_9BACL|nr:MULTISPECIES: Cof-type HAD-IIB family hydrolase [Paenibacillus]MED4604286.1 Cof-type HAD-IIB family hydrolase [Paenibacillus validus]MED4609699.1 Cof-type HAD-IIB family hydrolase [Paenibacillus validus]MUG74069.1 Cof-type HAD-IIB family hydrolase [Paenibacillus validus]
MNYRLIALDVDGTLLNDNHELTERTIRTLRLAHEAGLRIVLCTGRGPANAIPVFEELGLEGVLITHNGASTVQTPGAQVLHQFSFQMQELAPLVAYCRENGVHFDVNTPLDLYLEKAEAAAAAMYEQFLIVTKQVDDVLAMEEGIVKFTMFGDGDQMDRVEAAFGREFQLPETFHAIRSGVEFVDVMAVSASKGNALKHLADSWGIRREEIIAIGNYFNDVDMLRFAGLGIAMDNSPDGVKEAADEVTLSNNEDGVHAALMKHVLEPLGIGLGG